MNPKDSPKMVEKTTIVTKEQIERKMKFHFSTNAKFEWSNDHSVKVTWKEVKQ